MPIQLAIFMGALMAFTFIFLFVVYYHPKKSSTNTSEIDGYYIPKALFKDIEGKIKELKRVAYENIPEDNLKEFVEKAYDLDSSFQFMGYYGIRDPRKSQQ